MSRTSSIPHGLSLVGEIRGQGDLSIAGHVEGPVAVDGHLIIEASGFVHGEVKARSVVVRGNLHGPAIAEETIRLEPGAKMIGDARADRVSVVEGALLRGRITMTGAQTSRRSSPGGVIGMAAPPVVPRTSAIGESAGIAPRAVAGVLIEPRDEDERAAVAASDQQAAEVRPSEPPPSPPASARRPPDPVIPGVGRQRARRRDRGLVP